MFVHYWGDPHVDILFLDVCTLLGHLSARPMCVCVYVFSGSICVCVFSHRHRVHIGEGNDWDLCNSVIFNISGRYDERFNDNDVLGVYQNSKTERNSHQGVHYGIQYCTDRRDRRDS